MPLRATQRPPDGMQIVDVQIDQRRECVLGAQLSGRRITAAIDRSLDIARPGLRVALKMKGFAQRTSLATHLRAPFTSASVNRSHAALQPPHPLAPRSRSCHTET